MVVLGDVSSLLKSYSCNLNFVRCYCVGLWVVNLKEVWLSFVVCGGDLPDCCYCGMGYSVVCRFDHRVIAYFLYNSCDLFS